MRAILHSDMNSYYASVEMMLDPSLRGKAVAVCGSTETRHGIVLAKSELAKRAGVKTGMRVIKAGPEVLTEFNAFLFENMVEKIIVPAGNKQMFRLTGGLVLEEEIDRRMRR